MDRYITKDIKDVERLIGTTLINGETPKDKLNHTQIQIMFYLLKHKDENICQKDLERETHLKKASITGTLDSLQDKGIIIRKQSEDDKRKNFIMLSQKALNARDKIQTKMLNIEERIKVGVTQEELDTFYRVMDKVKDNLTKKD